MSPWFHQIFLCLSLLMTSACQRISSPEIKSGNYKLVWASLNQAGKFKELACTGEFEFTLNTSPEGVIALEPTGKASCDSENPASFKETLGGDCELEILNFYSSNQGESYISRGSNLTCFASGNAEVKLTLQPISEKFVRITRTGSAESDSRSEIHFERVNDGV